MLDELAFVTLVACVMLYWILFRYRCHHPGACKRTVIDELYTNWVEIRMKEENPITAVQALRNMLMACSIFITSILILLGLLLSVLGALLDDRSAFMGIVDVSTGEVKAATISATVFFCLFCFVMAARLATRTSLLITSKPGMVDFGDGMDGTSVTRTTFKSMQNHWMFGIRSLFYMIGAISWLVSPLVAMITSIIITIYLVWFQDVWSIK